MANINLYRVSVPEGAFSKVDWRECEGYFGPTQYLQNGLRSIDFQAQNNTVSASSAATVSIIGYCLDDCTGCYLIGETTTTSTTIPPVNFTLTPSCEGSGINGTGRIVVSGFSGGSGTYSSIAIGNSAGAALSATPISLGGASTYSFTGVFNGTWHIILRDSSGSSTTKSTAVNCTNTTTTTSTSTSTTSTSTTSTTSTTTAAPICTYNGGTAVVIYPSTTTTTSTSTTSTSTTSTSTTSTSTTSTTTTTTLGPGETSTTTTTTSAPLPSYSFYYGTTNNDACAQTTPITLYSNGTGYNAYQTFWTNSNGTGIPTDGFYGFNQLNEGTFPPTMDAYYGYMVDGMLYSIRPCIDENFESPDYADIIVYMRDINPAAYASYQINANLTFASVVIYDTELLFEGAEDVLGKKSSDCTLVYVIGGSVGTSITFTSNGGFAMNGADGRTCPTISGGSISYVSDPLILGANVISLTIDSSNICRQYRIENNTESSISVSWYDCAGVLQSDPNLTMGNQITFCSNQSYGLINAGGGDLYNLGSCTITTSTTTTTTSTTAAPVCNQYEIQNFTESAIGISYYDCSGNYTALSIGSGNNLIFCSDVSYGAIDAGAGTLTNIGDCTGGTTTTTAAPPLESVFCDCGEGCIEYFQPFCPPGCEACAP
jgi:hypothetical protein